MRRIQPAAHPDTVPSPGADITGPDADITGPDDEGVEMIDNRTADGAESPDGSLLRVDRSGSAAKAKTRSEREVRLPAGFWLN
jgi:hypothetical protein